MKPIKLYFAGGEGKILNDLLSLGVKNKLTSYLYPKQLKDWLDLSEKKDGNIIVDSGAFSAWNKGDIIDITKYIEYCHLVLSEFKIQNKKVRFVNLDVIPGKKGDSSKLNFSSKKKDKDLIHGAAKQGYKNLLFFKRNDIVPIHVFHQGEDFEWLDKMLEETDYIGISPANDLPQKQKVLWIDRVFSYLEKNNVKVDTHGFAMWSPPSALLNYPWTSCDAITWRINPAYGLFFYPKGGFKNANDFSFHQRVECSERNSSLEMSPFFGELKELLSEDGYDLEEVRKNTDLRASISVRYFLEFEKWLNKKKGSFSFRQTKTFNLRG